jgi:hypothetical protein
VDDIKPKVIRIGGQDYIGEAESISKDTKVIFKLWVDENYDLYVQLIKSTGGTIVNTSLLFSVNDHKDLPKNYKSVKSLTGFDIHRNTFDKTTGDNNIRFLAAVIKDILPNQNSVSAADIKI